MLYSLGAVPIWHQHRQKLLRQCDELRGIIACICDSGRLHNGMQGTSRSSCHACAERADAVELKQILDVWL